MHGPVQHHQRRQEAHGFGGRAVLLLLVVLRLSSQGPKWQCFEKHHDWICNPIVFITGRPQQCLAAADCQPQQLLVRQRQHGMTATRKLPRSTHCKCHLWVLLLLLLVTSMPTLPPLLLLIAVVSQAATGHRCCCCCCCC